MNVLIGIARPIHTGGPLSVDLDGRARRTLNWRDAKSSDLDVVWPEPRQPQLKTRAARR